MELKKLIICITLLSVFVSNAIAQCAFDRSKTITINSLTVSGSSGFSNFPVLISFTDSDIATTSNGGSMSHTLGYDMAFKSADCDCWLDFEIEEYNAVSGKISVWVRIPVLKYNENTEIEMYFGNASISSNPSSNHVWDSNYSRVLHLQDDFDDASQSGSNATNNGSSDVTGFIGDGQSFDGANDYIQTSNTTYQDFTMSMWMKAAAFGANANSVAYGGSGLIWSDLGSCSNDMIPLALNNATFQFGDDDGSCAYNTLSGSTSISTSTWYYVVVTRQKSSGTKEIWVNGTSVGSQSSHTVDLNANSNLIIGGNTIDGRYFNGIIDEVRFSKEVRSDDWIKTEYNNQNSPSTFLTIGAQKIADCPGPGGVGQMDGNTDLVLWMKADCGVEDANHEYVSNGASVKYWKDQSGKNNLATAANDPTFNSSFQNGKPSVSFNGTSNYFDLADPSALPIGTTGRTYFMVTKSTGSLDRGTFSHGTNTPGNKINICSAYDQISLGVNSCRSGSNTTNTNLKVNVYKLATNGQSDDVDYFIDGEELTSTNLWGTTPVTVNTGSTDAEIGRAFSTTTHFFAGDIVEIIVYNKELTVIEQAMVEDYLANKYSTNSPRSTGMNGPGGVGDTTSNSSLKLWLDIQNVSASDGDRVTNWEDKSGNEFDFSSGNGATYNSSSVNGYGSFSFNGSSDYFEKSFESELNTDEYTVFVVDKPTSDGDYKAVLSNRDDPPSGTDVHGFILYAYPGSNNWSYWTGTSYYWNSVGTGVSTAGTWASQTLTYNSATNGKQLYINGNLNSQTTTTLILNAEEPYRIGAGANETSPSYHFQGEVSEVIQYNESLNESERVIVENYLAEKYDLTMSGTDYFSGHTGAYDECVQGVGTSDGTIQNSHIQARNSGGLELAMYDNSFNVSNEYVLAGYKEASNGVVADDVPVGVTHRWKRVWYLDVTGDVNIELDFNLQTSETGGFPDGSNYVLLFSPTNAFSFTNWTAARSIAPTMAGGKVTFNVTSTNLVDGYYTLASVNSSSSPLPIELIDFTAKPENNKRVDIKWSTASEVNNHFFTIQKLNAEHVWEDLFYTNGAGNSTDVLNYQEYDENPTYGLSYYRLKQTDYDGSSSYSAIRVVELANPFEELGIYPNPSSGQLFVESNPNVDLTIRVFNVLGEKIKEIDSNYQERKSINVSNWVNGVYFLEFSYQGESFRTKFIVQH